jgi:hypothetical protein
LQQAQQQLARLQLQACRSMLMKQQATQTLQQLVHLWMLIWVLQTPPQQQQVLLQQRVVGAMSLALLLQILRLQQLPLQSRQPSGVTRPGSSSSSSSKLQQQQQRPPGALARACQH